MKKHSRRRFLQIAGLGAAAGSTFIATSKEKAIAEMQKGKKAAFHFGIASYTFRKIGLDETLQMTKLLGLDYIAFKSFHLPLESTQEEIKAVADKVKNAGLTLYGGGVIYMKNESEINNAFDYAKAAGMSVIIGVPEHEFLALVDQKVKEYDIKVAIHNHGPGDKVYPSPESVYEKIKGLDQRIGLCIDIGHTQRIGLDPSEEAKKYADRLLDIHIKDVSAATAEGKTVEIGRGVIDIPKFLRMLIDLNYQGIAAIEYEKDEDNPLPGVAESIGYLRGVMAVI